MSPNPAWNKGLSDGRVSSLDLCASKRALTLSRASLISPPGCLLASPQRSPLLPPHQPKVSRERRCWQLRRWEHPLELVGGRQRQIETPC